MTFAIVRRSAWVLLAILMLTNMAFAADAPPTPEAIRLQAQACADAMLKGDLETFANFTHPKLIELMGGRAKFIDAIKQGNAEMKAQKSAITGFSTRAPEGVVKGGNDLFAVVPMTLTLTQRETKVSHEGYLVAVSSDGGTKWTFITGDERAKLKEILPNLPEELKLPAPPAKAAAKPAEKK
jgi:hypothetical protein